MRFTNQGRTTGCGNGCPHVTGVPWAYAPLVLSLGQVFGPRVSSGLEPGKSRGGCRLSRWLMTILNCWSRW